MYHDDETGDAKNQTMYNKTKTDSISYVKHKIRQETLAIGQWLTLTLCKTF